MNKLNFISNPRIIFFADGTEHENGTEIRPEQIPSLIIPALCKAAGSDIIISINFFAEEEYENYVKALMVTWDGCCVIKRMAYLYSNGSYSFSEYDGHIAWNIM